MSDEGARVEESAAAQPVAIITGASRGIGAAIARRMAGDGYSLVLNYLSDHEAMDTVRRHCEGAGAEVVVQQGDVSQAQTAAALCARCMERFRRVDVLVNNAGMMQEGLLARLSDASIEAQVQTNIMGVVWTSRAVMRPMLRQRRGVIVNLSSALATRPGGGCSVYAGTKGFVESFTRSLAAEMGRKGLRALAVAPGIIETEMSAGVAERMGDGLAKMIGSGRLGRAEEIARVVAFMASDAACYVNGAVVAVDGAYLGGR